MRATDAAELINRGLVFKPGWWVRATPYDRYSSVIVEAELRTNNFNREEAPHYRSPIIAGGSFEVSTEGDEAEVLQRLIGEFVKIEEHEWREALRLKDRGYVAPFHPHRPEGNALWATPQMYAGVA